MSESIAPGAMEAEGQARKPFSKAFVVGAGVILAITGIAKVWSGMGNAKFLSVADPITGVQFRLLLVVVGVVELVIALVCFFSKGHKLPLWLAAWLATNFVLYRFGLWWMDWHRPCSCLGNLTDALRISPQLADNIMKLALAYLLLGSYASLFWLWRQKKRNVI